MYDGHVDGGGAEPVPGAGDSTTPTGVALIAFAGSAGATLALLFPPTWLPVELVVAFSIARYAVYWGLFRRERWAYHGYLVIGTIGVVTNTYAGLTGNPGAATSVVFHFVLLAYVYWRSDVFTNAPMRVR
jgi:hypothetical protein